MNEDILLTILTPSYNRSGDKLERLYNSLTKQVNTNFQWFLIDDGSTDETKDQVAQYIEEKKISIKYIYRENGGKHRALNTGISNIDTVLTMIVDSDDYLTEDAVANIHKAYEKYKDDESLCGFSFLRVFTDGKINGKEFEPDYLKASYIDSRINADDTMADKAEVFFTRCLKEYPFPEYEGERFLGEDIVWIRMARKYQMIHINKGIYVGEYLEGGLTKNRRKNNIKSPIGCMERAKEFMKNDIGIKYRIKGGLQYVIYGRFAGLSLSELIKKSENKLLMIVCIVPGLMLQAKWKRDVNS